MVSAENIREFGYDDYFLSASKCPVDCNARGMAWGTYNITTTSTTADTAVARLKKLRYIHYQNSYKPMDRNQMLQEIHNQHHHNKEYDKYITGDCYGYKIYEVEVCDKGHEHKTELDSCWGYYDEDDCTNEAKGIIEHYQTKLEVC